MPGHEMTPDVSYKLRGRGFGLNWLDCIRCGSESTGVRRDEAFVVPGHYNARVMAGSLRDHGVTVKLDIRDYEPFWTQLKFASCGDPQCDTWLDRLDAHSREHGAIKLEDLGTLFPGHERHRQEPTG